MFNRQLKRNIKALDLQIGKLSEELKIAKKGDILEQLKKIEELTKIRCQLAESKARGSYKSEIISGIVGLSAIILVLKYEETNIVTSKAMNLVTRLFKGV